MVRAARARCKAIKHVTKIISGEFGGDLIQVKRGINIKQMLQFVFGLLAAQQAAILQQSLHL